MSSSKGSSNSNKTAHVMNLLRKSNPAPEASAQPEQQPAAVSDAPAPQVPPILTALNADADISLQIRDALEDALAEEVLSSPPQEFPPATPESVPVSELLSEALPAESGERLSESEVLSVPEEHSPLAESETESEPESDSVPEPESEAESEPPVQEPVVPEEEPAQAPAEDLPPMEKDEAIQPQSVPSNEPAFINVMQMLTEEKADKYIELFGLCSCARCRNDVIALTLNELMPKYVVMRPSELTIRSDMYTVRYSSAITAQLLRACREVMDHPRHDE